MKNPKYRHIRKLLKLPVGPVVTLMSFEGNSLVRAKLVSATGCDG